MRILVLGGTVFLSRALAQEYLERGHDVTCLARGADHRAPEGARAISVDRARGESAFGSVREPFDAVVDVASDPRFVRAALDALGGRTDHWTYVSSCSVYADQDGPGADESRAILEPLVDFATSSPENYGASKSACEAMCRDVLDDRLLVVRPGLIVGPGDASDRGGYWPARFARSPEDVLVPEAKGLWAQIIDVNDLVRWVVTCTETRTTGTMNAVGEPRVLREVIDDARRVAGSTQELVVVDDQWLLAQAVAPWAGECSLPLWIPRGQGFDGFTQRSSALARHHGLSLTPLETTLLRVLEFERTAGLGRPRLAGLDPGQETRLIERWRGEPSGSRT